MINQRLILAVVVIAVNSGFQFGYNIGVINAPQAVLEKFINNTGIERNNVGFTEFELAFIWGLVVAIYAVGGMFGGLSTKLFADKLGRKKGLIIVNIFAIVGGILMESAKLLSSYEIIIVSRLILGYGSGVHLGVAPLFLVEIAPIEWRGFIGSTFQLVVTISILFSQILGQPEILGTDTLWPTLFALVIIPAVLQSFMLLFIPESPRFILWKYESEEKMKKSLSWLRQTDDIETEVENIKTEVEDAAKIPKTNPLRLIKDPIYKPLFYISMAVMISQQLSGINAIISYSTHIFQAVGIANEYALYATMGIGVVNVLITIVSLWLVEQFGRRKLYLLNVFSLIIINILITVFFKLQEVVDSIEPSIILVVMVYLFIIVFATGLGGIPLFVVNELFDQNTRSLASSFAVFVNWFCSFIVVLAFPTLDSQIKGYVFLVFAGALFLVFIYAFFIMPETKNKNPESIRQAMQTGINLRTGLSKANEAEAA